MTDNTEHTTTETTEPTAAAGRRSLRTTTQHLTHTARHLGHPVVHVAGLLVAHIIAVAVLEKTPPLTCTDLPPGLGGVLPSQHPTRVRLAVPSTYAGR